MFKLLPESVLSLERLDFVLGHFSELLGPPGLEVGLGFFVAGETELFHDDLLDGVGAEGGVCYGWWVFPGVLN